MTVGVKMHGNVCHQFESDFISNQLVNIEIAVLFLSGFIFLSSSFSSQTTLSPSWVLRVCDMSDCERVLKGLGVTNEQGLSRGRSNFSLTHSVAFTKKNEKVKSSFYEAVHNFLRDVINPFSVSTAVRIFYALLSLYRVDH